MAFKRKPPTGNVRRVQTNGVGVRGVITNKAGRIVQFESFAERSLLLRLDRDPDVTDYLSQPEQITFIDQAMKQRSYVPDFKVWYGDGRVALHEVSMSHRQMSLALQDRHQAARDVCLARGWQFILHRETDLPQGSELANLLALWRYRPSTYFKTEIWDYIHKALHKVGRTPVVDLTHRTVTQVQLPLPEVASAVYHALWHGHLMMDWHQLLFIDAMPQPQVHVWLPEGDVSHEH